VCRSTSSPNLPDSGVACRVGRSSEWHHPFVRLSPRDEAPSGVGAEGAQQGQATPGANARRADARRAHARTAPAGAAQDARTATGTARL